jgi:PKD repeat protein
MRPALLTAVLALALTAPAQAAVTNVVPLDGAQNPIVGDTILDTTELWAYVTSATGGAICVHRAPAVGASCDEPGAWGKTPVPPMYAGFVPMVAGDLPPGNWVLLGTEAAGDEVTAVSGDFTVAPCTICGAGAVAKSLTFVQQSSALLNSIESACDMLGALSVLYRVKQVYDASKATYIAFAGVSGWGFGASLAITAGAAGVATFKAYEAPLPGPLGMIATGLCTAVGGLPLIPQTGFAWWVERWANDPPDPAYAMLVSPDFTDYSSVPGVPADGYTPERIKIDRMRALAKSSLTAFERYQAAEAASSKNFVHAQSRTLSEHLLRYGHSLTQVAKSLDAAAARVRAQYPAAADRTMPQADIDNATAFIDRVRADGFLATEVDQLHLIDVGDAAITRLRQDISEWDPSDLSGPVVIDQTLETTAGSMRDLAAASDAFARAAAVKAGRTNVAPVADFSWSSDTGLGPLNVAFADLSNSTDLDPVAVTWDFGDGVIATGSSKATVTHTYLTPGVYNAKVTVSDELATATKTRKVFVGRGNLTVRALTMPEEHGAGATPFAFSSAALGAFNLVHGGEKSADLAAGSYVVTQAADAGYRTQDITCDDHDSAQPSSTSKLGRSATVALEPGEDVTCTFRSLKNTPPVAAPDAVMAAGAGPTEFTQLLSNDSDANGDDLTITSHGTATSGTVACAATSCTYEPQTSQVTSDTFTYTVSDGQGGSATATVTVTVRPNQAPVAADDTATTSEDLTINRNLLTNDTDPDGDALQLADVRANVPAGLECAPTGLCYFTPRRDFSGQIVVTYRVTDGSASDTATMTLTVTPGNDAPVANADTATVPQGTSEIAVLGNDRDADGDPLTLTLQAAPGHGTAVCASQKCSYTPTAGYAGADSFTYRIADPSGAFAVGTVNLTVRGGPAARATATPPRGLAPQAVTFDARASVGAGPLRFAWNFGDGHTATGAVVSHRFETGGTSNVVLTVTDSQDRVDTQTIPVFVQAPDYTRLPFCSDATGAIDDRCPGFEPQSDVQLFRVPGTGKRELTFTIRARFGGAQSELAVFPVDDALGTLGSLAPGEAGWTRAAFDRAQLVFGVNTFPSAVPVQREFDGGSYLAFILVTSGTLTELRVRNPDLLPLTNPYALFSVLAANTDHVDHVLAYRRSGGSFTQFGFEDILNGGDFDYDDVVFEVTPGLSAIPPVTTSLEADAPSIAPGGQTGYTITARTSYPAVIPIAGVEQVLPAGFAYRPGTTSGATSADPQVDGRTLRWPGPLLLEPGDDLQLHVGVVAATNPGTYRSQARIDAEPHSSRGTGATAPVTVTVPEPEPPTSPPVVDPPPPLASPPPPPPPPPPAPPPKIQVAAVRFASLPAARGCVSRRRFRIRLRGPGKVKLKSARVLVNGKPVKTLRGSRITAPVNLVGLPKGRFKVTVILEAADGRRYRDDRQYRTCAGKRR